MVADKGKRKYRRIFFATDLHGSEIVFRKFIGAAKFYDVDALIMGGDVFGKTFVPLVMDDGGRYSFDFHGQSLGQIPEGDLPKFEGQFMNAGEYQLRIPKRDYEELLAAPEKVSALFEKLMSDRLSRWASLATENLAPLGVKCYWTGGNDDRQEVLDRVVSTDHFVNVDGKVTRIDNEHELASLGWSNPTPWKTPRECSEEELSSKLDQLTRHIVEPSSCIFNIHPPPYNSNLDTAAKLDASFDPPRPVTSGGQQVLIPVGSTSVRSTIERVQPLLMLCVEPSTVILGDNIQISEIRVGGHAVGMFGMNRVKKTFARTYSGDLTKIKGGGLLPFSVTPEHPILAVRKKRTITRIDGLRRNVNLFSEPRWTSPDGLKPVTTRDTNGDYLVLPRLTGTVREDRIPLREFVKLRKDRALQFPLTENTAWLLGQYVAEGHRHRGGLVFSSNTSEIHIRRRIQEIANTLGLASRMYPNPRESVVSLMVFSSILSRAFPAWCGHLAPNKKIPDFVLFHMNESLLRAFLEGYEAGDGHREYNGSDVEKLTTTSRTLALQLQLAYARLGIVTSIYINRAHEDIIQGRRVWSKQKCRIGFSLHPRWTKSYVQKDRILIPVRRVSKHKFRGTVCNLSTSDETYIVSNVVTHNCGHIHETKNDTKIKRTVCINPGSEYNTGLLRGTIVNVERNKVLSHQFTSG